LIGQAVMGDPVTLGGFLGGVVSGGISGGIIGATGGLSLLGGTAVGAGAAAVGYGVQTAIDRGFSWADLGTVAGLGGVLGGLGTLIPNPFGDPAKWGAGGPGALNTFLGNNLHGQSLWGGNLAGFPGAVLAGVLGRVFTGGPGGTNVVTVTHDPNGLIGPAGYGSVGYIAANALLSYRIDFENSTNASAPSQQVSITDQLGNNYDWTTFNVCEFGFGDLVVSLALGASYVQTNVPFSYLGTTFQVQVQIGIRPTTGLVYANFQAIDPATSLPPPAGIGFLPPEDGTGRGQGHVAYTIRAKTGLATGAQLANVGLISFDEEPQIATDQVNDSNPAAGTDPTRECLLTMDTASPVSTVSPLPAVEKTASFVLAWTGSDIGSGIAFYDIYVSADGGAWTSWQRRTTSTSAQFTGSPGHTYDFYSVATDNVGNQEAAPSSAQASTTVTIPFLALPQQTNLVVDELTMMVVTNTATEANPSAYPLSYVLLGAPSGATIDTNGIITWIPSQAQSPGTNVLTTTVTDAATPPNSATNTFTVIVNEVNVAPVLAIIGTQTVNELTLLTVTNTASESNIHSSLGYALVNPPAGMGIDTNGVITWTPQQNQSPGTNLVTTVVTNSNPYDLVNPYLSATNTFTAIVNEVNVAPVLPVLGAQTVNELTLLTVTNTASESNIHSTLGYALVNPPAGMSIDTNGVITWTPQQNQSPSTNLVTTIVANSNPYDLVNPHLSATNTFTVIVKAVNAPELEIVLVGGQPQLTWSAVPGWRYQVWVKQELGDTSWTSVGGVLTASGGTLEFTDSTTSGTNARFYGVQMLGPQ
jgi:hypothetical protein